MNRSILLASLWGLMYILCAVLGFVEDSTPLGMGLMTGMSLAFFLPPFLLLREGKPWRKRLLWISIASLVLTLVLLCASILSFAGSETLGNVLHAALVLVSVPMIAGRYWVVSLFLWACLLFSALQLLIRKKAA